MRLTFRQIAVNVAISYLEGRVHLGHDAITERRAKDAAHLVCSDLCDRGRLLNAIIPDARQSLVSVHLGIAHLFYQTAQHFFGGFIHESLIYSQNSRLQYTTTWCKNTKAMKLYKKVTRRWLRCFLRLLVTIGEVEPHFAIPYTEKFEHLRSTKGQRLSCLQASSGG